jgi:phosphoglycerate dehydrogenase-like enzyme
MPEMEGDELAALPSLEAVFYAAGSVQSFARPFLNRGITVVSAWAANGVPVAEFTLAQILLSCKGYFRNTRDCRNPDQRHLDQVFRGSGTFGETVGLIGVGIIARSAVCSSRSICSSSPTTPISTMQWRSNWV